MKLVVIGAGYVGLVAAACLADLGHAVRCAEHDPRRLSLLQAGEVPLHEPGLEDVFDRVTRAGRLVFSGDTRAAASGAEIAFLAVGTPPGPDGLPDVSDVQAAAAEVAAVLAPDALLVVKSTVPVGTAESLRRLLDEHGRHDVAVVSNPEFLAEGTAVVDFTRPDRVVLGHSDPKAGARMEQLYAPLVRKRAPVMHMDNASAEMAKYAANAMLAARVSLINELAELAEAAGADIELVRRVVGADDRIGSAYLYAGCGYGGSCFPKDLLALEAMASRLGAPARMVPAIRHANTHQKTVPHAKLVTLLGPLAGRRIGVWGLSFKPGTDDIRQAPALTLIDALLEDGAVVAVFDPEAIEVVRARYGDKLHYADDALDAAHQVDALAVVTEWNEFRGVDLSALARTMRGRIIVDGRNLWEPSDVVAHGLVYASIGRPTALPDSLPAHSASTQEGA